MISISILLTLFPLIGILISGTILIFYYFKLFSISSFLNNIWIILIVSSFLGSYLGIPGQENIFLFRVLLFVQVSILIVQIGKRSIKLEKDSQYVDIYRLLIVWVVVCFLSLFWAKYISVGMRYGYYAFEGSIFIFFTSLYVKNRKNWITVSRVITLVYVSSLIVGIFEVLSGQHLSRSGSLVYETTTSQFQPTGFLYNTNDYALYLTIFLPMVFYYLYTIIHTKWSCVFSVIVWISSIYLVISTYSRLGMLAMLIISIVIYLVYFNKKTIYFLTLFFVYLLVSEILSINILKKIETIITSSFTNKKASTSDRLDLYTTTWHIFKTSNFVGIGAGGVPIEIESIRLGHDTAINSGHNFILEVLGEIGIFIFPLILFFLILIYRSIIFYKTTKKGDLLPYLPILMLLNFFIASIALSTIIEQRYLWFALGLSLVLSSFNKKDGMEWDI